MTLRVLRSALSALLIVSFLVTGHAVAQARGANPAVDKMVLCIGTTSVVVFTDANGQPTSPPHLCLECLTGVLAAVLPPVLTGERSVAVAERQPWSVVQHIVATSCGALLQARDPPTLI